MNRVTVRSSLRTLPRLLLPNWRAVLIHAVLLSGALVMVTPFLWMVTLSLKPVELTYQPPHLLPTRFEISNYTII